MSTRRTKRARPVAYAAGLALMLAASSLAQAQDQTIELRLSHWVPPSHPLHKAIGEWGADVEKASGGTIKYKVFPAQQLGKAFDHYDMVRDGIADFVYVSPSFQPGRFQIIAAGELPFLIGNAKDGGNLAIDEWYRKHVRKEMTDVHYCFSFLLDPMTWHSSKMKIVVPGDLNGVKVRPSHGTMAAWVQQLGATTVQASAPEVRDLIEKSAVEAATFSWGSVLQLGIDKVTRYHMDAPVVTTTFQWLMNLKTYDAMSAAQKKVIDDHCTTPWAARFANPWADFERSGLAKLKAMQGHEVYTISDAQLGAWKKSAEPLHKKWASDVSAAGGNPGEIMKDLTETLAKYHAAY